ncbi:MAG: hypothetical protein JWO86_4856, partial [Myxococcaceae bacterium]|nr:hypothetical protein [Myxococcaceae bacterium]
ACCELGQEAGAINERKDERDEDYLAAC